MPALKRAHERFVQEYVANGQDGKEAYMAAFPNCKKGGASAAASRLLTSDAVKQRIADTQRTGTERAEVTLENLIKEAGDIQRAALDAKSYAVAISALTAKAKLSGLWVERTQGENTNVNYAVSDQPPSDEEWERQHVTAN